MNGEATEPRGTGRSAKRLERRKPTRFFDGRHWEEAQRLRIAEGGHRAAAGLSGAVTLESILDRAPE